MLLVQVAEVRERPTCRPSLLQVGHASDHVNHRLGRKTRDCGQTDVVDSIPKPGRKRVFEDGTLSLELAWPLVAVRDDDKLSFHTRSLNSRRRWTAPGSVDTFD